MSKDVSGLTPQQKAAAVVISLGAERASKIYKFLGEEDLEILTLEIAKLNHVSPTQTEAAMDDFYKLCLTQKVITEGGVDYAKTVLEKAFGPQTATTLLERVTRNLKTRAFEFIRKTDSKNLYAIIQHERPQTIALILSYAKPEQASEIITELPKEKQVKVVECIARMDSASPETIKIVENILEKKFASVLSLDFAQVGGVDYIAEVMNNIDRSNEKYIFDELSKKDIKLADDIRNRMFVFEDITLLDDRGIQEFLREVETQDIVYALKGSTQEVSNMIFANMSSRMAETVKSELEFTYNVRLKDVEEAQQKIVAVIRRLEEEGRLMINKGGKDEIIA
ncbi:flagellar motor switch protein FliG [Aminipila sp.]|jgi:flagellar motor switch protein FliG|uniref:flagellar motor switch protein FliG n=1 Tax=Aminipila sp. TaxID=2060095 RepID=UPI001D251933|nr:flagellar motor switch protein FliG [Aminipila sp.]MBE6033289.1 flagellar motor switch protein FliG [Clostridiales bacterium]